MAISHAQKLNFAAIYLLKKIDLKPEEGGIRLPALLDGIYAPLEEVVDKLLIEGHVELDRKSQAYRLTKRGSEYIGSLIDEAEGYVDEFDDQEIADVVDELRARNIDPLRVRFLWGWYQGEFDDVALFQQRRGFVEVEPEWPLFVLSDDFYDNLELDVEGE
jgi:hypothetical protein